MTNANIEFIVKKHFNAEECDNILQLVEQSVPGICDAILRNAPDGAPTQNIYMQQYRTKNNSLLYRVPLQRNLLANEVEKIKEHISNYLGYEPKIKYSTLDEYQKTIKVEPVDFEEQAILASIARKRHDNWVNEMVSKGWQYGIEENHFRKTHPLLRPWSSLPKETLRKDLKEIKFIRNNK